MKIGVISDTHDQRLRILQAIDIFRKVTAEVKQFMEQNGYGTIKEMVGITHE